MKTEVHIKKLPTAIDKDDMSITHRLEVELRWDSEFRADRAAMWAERFPSSVAPDMRDELADVLATEMKYQLRDLFQEMYPETT